MTYSVSANLWYEGTSTSYAGNTTMGTQSVVLMPVASQPSGVTQNFQRIVTVHRMEFGTDSTCATPVHVGGAYIHSSLGSVQMYPGNAVFYYLTPNDSGIPSSVMATMTVTAGSNIYADTFSIGFSNIDVSPSGDAVVDHCFVIPTGAGDGSLGNIVTPIAITGHTLDIVALSGTGADGNTRDGQAVTGATTVSLINLIPENWSFSTSLQIDSGDNLTYMELPCPAGSLPCTAGISVTAGVTSNASEIFSGISEEPLVFTPPTVSGELRILDSYAAANPGLLQRPQLSQLRVAIHGRAVWSGLGNQPHGWIWLSV